LEDAIAHWEVSAVIPNDFATVNCNLVLVYFNKHNNPQAALISLEKAFACEMEDTRVFFELDQGNQR
jgi:hypothetical protein